MITSFRFSALLRNRISDKVAAESGSRCFVRMVVAPCACVLTLVTALAFFTPFRAAPSPETISTFAPDCTTPKSVFNLGDTVCAQAAGSPLGPPVQRRFEWVSPDGLIFQLGPDITADPQTASITIPSTGSFARVGTWSVKTVDVSNDAYSSATFTVRDPAHAAVDLWTPLFGPAQVSAGSSAPFTAFVTNRGPDDAHSVELTVAASANATFQSETQLSGPAFTCTNPPAGGTGASTCTIAILPAGSTAALQFVYLVDPGASPGEAVSCTATVTSSTSEIFAVDNTSTATVTIAAATCDVTCPGDISVTKTAGQCGAVVTFSTPTGSGSGCGTVACNPASGSTFPLGATNVICFGDTGGPCAFTVTVEDPQAPTITCPANISVDESSPGIGVAAVNYSAPTLNDSCPAPLDVCSPPSGSSFPVGTTTVSCQVSNTSGTANCSFTVTVDSLVCVLSCPADVTASENPSGSGSATVTFSSPTSSGCSGVTITCSPPSGATFPLGSTAVNCSAKDGSDNVVASCSFTVTVVSATCVVTCPDDIVAVNSPGQCGAVVSYPSPSSTGSCAAITCTPPSGSFFPVGTSNVTCTPATGSACSFTVTVQDAESPVISCPVDVTVNLPPNTTDTSMPVNYSVTATDNCSGVTVSSDPPSGSVFPLGTTIVNATATDSSGNSTSCSFRITVLYDFTGFFPPIANPPTLNVVNAGKGVPVKFSLSGNKGVAIFAVGSPSSGVIACNSSDPVSDVQETITAGGSSLSYDPTSDQYIYVWKTDPSWAGTCRQLVLQLNDGSVHTANFKFK